MIPIETLHVELKHKLNKVDSQQNLNFRIPQLDLFLNDALMLYVKLVAQPRTYNQLGLGFEISQRNIDDIRPLVKNNIDAAVTNTGGTWLAVLPSDYMFHLASYAEITKNSCSKTVKTSIIQHDDNETDLLSRSSFEWETVNIRFYESGIRIFAPDFTPTALKVDYIRKPLYMHYAEGYGATGSYTKADGTVLTGKQDCELPEHVGQEIVNLARHLILKSISNNTQVPSTLFDNS